MTQKLTKDERVRRRADYLRIQGSGRKIHSASFLCFGALGVEGPPSCQREGRPAKLGITVSRRVGGAVVRNRIKRLVREVFRRHKPVSSPGLELVVIARPEAAQLGYADVERQLCEVLRRIECGGLRPRPQK